MKKITRTEAADWLKKQTSVCILTHVRPDGDTLGSAAALCRGLRALGIDAWVLENPGTGEKQQYLLQGLTADAPAENAVLVSVDVASAGMLYPEAEPYLPRIALRIDHHGSAMSFTDMELVDPEAAACGEIVWDLLGLMGVTLSREMAVALYVAVSTDTGCFRYANTTAHSYETAAACAATGAELYPITEELFVTNTLGKLKMQSWILDHAEFFAGGRGAVCAIPREVEDTVSKDDMESLSGLLRTIEGVEMSGMLRQKPDGTTKLSVRAVPGRNAGEVCARFGGGGHKGAAGASLALDLESARQQVKDAITQALEDT